MKKMKRFSFVYQLEPPKILFWGYLLYISLGWFLLSLPFFQKIKVTFLDSLFVSASAVSTTGLSPVSVHDSFTIIGEIIILALIQLGGIGYMTFGSFVVLMRKNTMSTLRESVLGSSFELPGHYSIKKFVKSIVIYTLSVEAIGAILLFFAFKKDASLNPVWNAIFHSVSSFCTAGFSLYNNSLESYSHSIYLNTVVSALSLLGAIGYIVAVDVLLVLKGMQKRITFTSRIILSMTIFVLFFGTGLVFITESSLFQMPAWERLLASFFQVMSAITTVGFNTVPIGKLALSSLFLINIFMIIGASPSGTGGGIKSTSISAIYAIVRSAFRVDKRILYFNKIIPFERVVYAMCTFSFYIAILAIGLWGVLITDSNFSFNELFFEVCSALGTVGLSTGITSLISPLGKIIFVVLMFIGRLGPLSFGMAVFYKVRSEVSIEDIAI
ncbi:MAG: potassium transporter KtrB [Candidatus Cloacimonetes bacterium]|nr:potassium transporter KtrB [Candidatus Cloacimonadota bacterium]